MVTYRETIPLETRRGVQAIDITDRVAKVIEGSGVRDGLACVFTPSSTSAIVTNEFEPGLMDEDIPKALDRLFPLSIEYGHERGGTTETATATSAPRSSDRASPSRSSTAVPLWERGSRSSSSSSTTNRGIARSSCKSWGTAQTGHCNERATEILWTVGYGTTASFGWSGKF